MTTECDNRYSCLIRTHFKPTICCNIFLGELFFGMCFQDMSVTRLVIRLPKRAQWVFVLSIILNMLLRVDVDLCLYL